MVCVGYLGCRIANRIKAAGWLRYEPRSFNFGERTTTAGCHGFFLARGTPPEILVPPTTLPLMNSVPRRESRESEKLLPLDFSCHWSCSFSVCTRGNLDAPAFERFSFETGYSQSLNFLS